MKKVLASVLALLMLVGCSGGSASYDKLVIGMNWELTGAVADYGNSEFNGAKLAIKVANENGGFNGADVEYISYDNKSDSAEAQSIQTKLAQVDKVSAAVSPATSGATSAVWSLNDETLIPTVAASATANGITQDENGNTYSYAFRICFLDSFQGQKMAEFAYKNLSATKAVIYTDTSSDYGTGLRDAFTEQFTSLGGTVVASESWVAGDTDFNAALTKIAAMDFDVLYVPGYYTEAGLIIKQARELGINCAILGADGFDSPSLADIAGSSALNNVYFTTAYTSLSTDEDLQAFISAYKAEYGEDPDMFAALAYDATMIIIDTANKAGSAEPKAIRDGLEAITSYKGVTGTLSFDEYHNAVKSVIVVELKNGEQTNPVEVK